MSDNQLVKKIINKMLAEDKFSEWLGIHLIVVEPGLCILKMKVREEMVNGLGIAHGGIAFSLADSALAFASNAYGRLSVALECSISFAIPVNVNDELTCEAKELSLTNRTGTYHIEVCNQKNEKVAFFKGTVYRTSKEWEVTEEMVTNKRIATNDTNKEVADKRIITNDTDREVAGKRKLTNANVANEKLIYPELSYKIIGAAFEVYNNIGPSHKEAVYQKALDEMFKINSINFAEQVCFPVKLKTKTVGKNFVDFIVDEKIVVEIKSSSSFTKTHFDQLLNYLIVSNYKLGLLISFGRDGVKYKRVLNIDLLNKEKQ